MPASELTVPVLNPPTPNAQAVASVTQTPPPRPDGRPATAIRWAVTLTATVASTVALDVASAAAGVALAASHLLDDAHRAIVIGFLVASYALWAAGLRVNLMANWRLLEETGTSTNALSKAAFEFALARTRSRRVARAATAAGYVVTEVAKEAPYYAGAFGAALFSESVDSTTALIFLGGANLGAAAYEYSVSRLVRRFLDARSRRIARAWPSPCASFDTDWTPLDSSHRLLPGRGTR